MNSTSQAHGYGSGHGKPPRSEFLFPLRLPLIQSQPNPLLGRLVQGISGHTRLPFDAGGVGAVVGSFGGAGAVVGSFGGPRPGGLQPGGGSSIDDESTPLPAHLLVLFVLQRMENEIVSGGGVTAPCFARWELHSSAATEELGVLYALPAPLPGDVWWLTDHANGIYQGVVVNGCGQTPTFPVEIDSWVGEQENILDDFDEIGHFHAVDNTTIQPNGFWTFAYTIRATGTNGGVSDFKFNGIVSVTCSTQTSV